MLCADMEMIGSVSRPVKRFGRNMMSVWRGVDVRQLLLFIPAMQKKKGNSGMVQFVKRLDP